MRSLLIFFGVTLLALSLLITTSTAQKPTNSSTSIIGGSNAFNGQFPWTVYLTYSQGGSRIACMGVLIDLQWVMSAAHCLFNVPSSTEVTVSAGSIDLSTATKITVDRFIVNPSYNSFIPNNDISLLHLSVPFVASATISTIPISLVAPVDNEIFATAGFGLTRNCDISSIPTNNLQWVNLPYINFQKCRSRITFTTIIESTMICAGGENNPPTDTCQGDSGSGLIRTTDPTIASANQGVLGLTSFGTTRCASGFPAVYTRVATYYDWIVSTTGINIPTVTTPVTPPPAPVTPPTTKTTTKRKKKTTTKKKKKTTTRRRRN